MSFYHILGHDRFIDIIDCEKQVTYKMNLDDYIEYFESFERNKIYNVLSLEISNTKYVSLVFIHSPIFP
jgi:lysine-specific demethylase PHF8